MRKLNLHTMARIIARMLLTEKNCFTKFSTRIYCNRTLAVSDLFHMFTQSILYIPLSHTNECRCLSKSIDQIDKT